ncbi:MAG: hypothetical protein RLZZ197_1650, partial [Bacteroidota bacterium]
RTADDTGIKPGKVSKLQVIIEDLHVSVGLFLCPKSSR